MKIYLQDSAFAHCEFSNNPLPVKQRTDKVEWVRDNSFTSDDIVVWTDIDIIKSLDRTGPNIAWLIEAQPYHSQIYEFVRTNHDKFKAIWTHDRALIETVSNAIKLPFGGCWIDDFDWGMHPKTKDFSIIASIHGGDLPGHKMRRHIVAGAEGYIDLFGSGYNPIDNKITGLKDYRYTFCIENYKRDYWFTEKLIDCFMTGSLPIYWGCPSIGDFFNTDGMLCFEEINELPTLLKGCTPEYYESKLDAMKENYQLAQKFRLAELSIPSLMV
jgi:hypothetical protein